MLGPLVLILIFEEWGWEPLARAFALLARHRFWGWLESRIVALPPWAALMAFAIPVLFLVPIKLFALYLFSQGHVAWGLGLIVAAKIVGTAIAARLFQLTQPALLRIALFARLYLPWKRWKDGMLADLRATRPWRIGGVMKRRIRTLGVRAWSACKSALSL